MSESLRERLQANLEPKLQEQIRLAQEKSERYSQMLEILRRPDPLTFMVCVTCPDEGWKPYMVVGSGELSDILPKAKAEFIALNRSSEMRIDYSVSLFLDEERHPVLSRRVWVDETFWKPFV